MPGWRDEYLASIKEAEKNNPVNRDLVEACSQLQDRLAALEAEKAAWGKSSSSSEKAPVEGAEAAAAAAAASSNSSGSPDPTLARMKFDLAEALRSRGQLRSRLKAAEEELQSLKSRTTADGRALRTLTAERNALATKVRDRDEEIREKQKLVENVQDELIALNLQLNVSEQQTAKMRAENKELIERWMKRMGQEADAMNLANEPLMSRGE